MFDKLIESNSIEADFKPRGRYFTVSTVVVGILFLTAVVVSLYAQSFDLGTDNFEVSELLAPIAPEAPQPPEPARLTPQNTTQQPSDVPTRQVNMQRIDEVPIAPADAVSVTPNKYQSRPPGNFTFSNHDSDPAGPPSAPAGTGVTGSGSRPTTAPPDDAPSAPTAIEPPPPVRAAPPVKGPPVSIGVANGKATYLPKPLYSQAAQMVRAQGDVSVQITIDEHGKVISAKAVSGHAMLKGAAEKAAWSARFTPTLLSNVPVKVTGVIVYKFTR